MQNTSCLVSLAAAEFRYGALCSRQVPRYEGASSDPAFRVLVEEYHERYCAELKALWDAHKDTLAPERRRSMELVE